MAQTHSTSDAQTTSLTDRAPATHAASMSDWIAFALIVAIGGSAFAMIRTAVETIPPIIITVARLWIGAGFLYVVMRQAGRKLPPFFDQGSRKIAPAWRAMIAIGIVGYAGPFLIFPWAQQSVDSGLAGVYMAFMPIWTLGLAAIFANEALTHRKTMGFFLGLIGVLILMGPDVIAGAADGAFLAQAGMLLATLGYAAAAVITRRSPSIGARALSAGSVLCGAIAATPLLLIAEWRAGEWTVLSMVNVLGLGLGPTGLAGILLIVVIQRVGAGFMSLANYLTPVWAVILGAALFDEKLAPSAFAALALVLIGVAVSRRAPRATRSATSPSLPNR